MALSEYDWTALNFNYFFCFKTSRRYRERYKKAACSGTAMTKVIGQETSGNQSGGGWTVWRRRRAARHWPHIEVGKSPDEDHSDMKDCWGSRYVLPDGRVYPQKCLDGRMPEAQQWGIPATHQTSCLEGRNAERRDDGHPHMGQQADRKEIATASTMTAFRGADIRTGWLTQTSPVTSNRTHRQPSPPWRTAWWMTTNAGCYVPLLWLICTIVGLLCTLFLSYMVADGT